MRKLKKYKPTKFKAKTSTYNKELADYAVAFIESLCHTKGTWAGHPFELTNWLVVLFADEQGELPGLLRMWQTWDDTLDNRTDVGRMPACLRYDWDDHYIQEHRMECG